MLAATIDVIDDCEEAADGRRASERMAVDLPSTLRAPGREPLDVKVEDLSARGFRFESDRTLAVGATVRVGLCGAGTQDARIVRRDGRSFGCAFLEPLSAARMATAFTAAAVVQGSFGESNATAAAATAAEKWPGSVRVALLLGSGIGLWAALIVAARLALA